MQKSSFIQLLRQLNTEEQALFRDFVYSPIHNKRVKIRQLIGFAYQYAPTFSAKEMTKAAAIKTVFQQTVANNTAFNNILSDSLQLLYDFLAFQAYKANTVLQQNLLTQHLIKRNALSHAERTIKKYEKKISPSTNRNARYFEQHIAYHEKCNQLFLRKGRRGYDINLQKIGEHLNYYYLIRSLQLACEMASRNIITQANYDYHVFEQCFSLYEQNEALQGIPSIQIYYKTFLLITQNTQAVHYTDLRQLMLDHSDLLSRDDLNDIYGYILNYCVRQINLGKTEFNADIFEWYKRLLKEELLLDNQQMSDKAFMNIITVSLRMHAFDWTEHFIHQYKPSLKANIRANAVAFNLAALYYAKGDYDATLRQLIDVEFTDSFYHTRANTLQLKTYFELSETEAYFALIQSLRQYVQRSKELSAYHKSANLNFLRLAKQAYQVKLSKALLPKVTWHKKQKALQEKLAATNPLTDKEWLEEVCSCVKL